MLLGGLFPVTIQGAPVTPELRVAWLPLPGLAASAPMAAVTSLEAGPLTLTIVAPAVSQDALLAAADSTEQTLNTIQQAQQSASVTVEIVSSRDPTPIPQYYRYEVKPGETLTSIAQRFDVSNEYIVWNNIDVIDNAELLAIGDMLQVPAVPGIIHGIRAGETLTEIARAYDAEIDDIIGFSANGLSDPNSLKEGTFLLVVGGRRLPPAAATLRPTPTFVDRESSATGFSWPVFGTITSDFTVWHPLGIDMHKGVLYIADKYNNKIKRINPNTRKAFSLLGAGNPGAADGIAGEAEFHEPGGISVDGGQIYIADTNNHAIRVAALDTLKVSTLEIKGLKSRA